MDTAHCTGTSSCYVCSPTLLLLQTSQHPPSLHWHTPIDGRGLPSREMPPALQDQQHSTAPAVMHHMPHRLRHPRPYEPSDMALLHSHGRDAQTAGPPPNYSHDAMYRRPVREAPGVQAASHPLGHAGRPMSLSNLVRGVLACASVQFRGCRPHVLCGYRSSRHAFALRIEFHYL